MKVAVGLVVVLSLCAGCAPSGETEIEQTATASHSEEQAEVHRGYEGEEGPEHWADLSPEFVMCAEGVEQSPIDLTDATPVEGAAIERRIGTEVLTLEQRARVMDLVDNGHTIQITSDVPMALDIGSEHDPLWDPVIAALPSGPGDPRHLEDLQLDMNELRPLPARYYRYEGSLTTPPWSEGVQWIVMAEHRQISPEQMAAVVSHLHDNNRPVQPLGERELELISR